VHRTDNEAPEEDLKSACAAGYWFGCPRMLQPACDRGDLEACAFLARDYRLGLSFGVVDQARANQLYKRACDGGLPEAFEELGLGPMHREVGAAKRGTRPDELCDHRKLPADLEFPRGPDDLGLKYYCRGAYGLARDTFTRSCDRGSTAGCALLAFMYEHGKGVRQDSGLASRFYARACDCDNLWACGHLPPEAVAAGRDSDASACKPQPPPPCSQITLKRMPCYGTCAAEEMRISSEGSVRYENGGYRSSTIVKSIPGADATALFAQLECSDFWTWDSTYTPKSPDDPVASITIRLGLRAKTITYSPSCHTSAGAPPAPSLPRGLCDLQDAVEAAGGIMALTVCRDDAGAAQRCPEPEP
jgi:uncharacterized protein